MPALTRRHDPDRPDCWHVHYGDVRIGTIARHAGCPVDVAPRAGSAVYPGMEPGEHLDGTAIDFDHARADFEAAWRRIQPTRTDADFQAWRDQRDRTAWKYAMRDAGMEMPTQVSSGWSRCFCGAPIDSAGVNDHVRTAHSPMTR